MGSRLSTRAEAVKALALPSPRALDKLVERGAPAPKPGKRGTRRYDVAAIRAWQLQRQHQARPSVDLAGERAKLARVQTRLAQLKLRELTGELIREKDAVDVEREILGAVRAQLLAVPRRSVLAGLPREYEALVRQEIVAALRDLAGIQTRAGLQRAANQEPAA